MNGSIYQINVHFHVWFKQHVGEHEWGPIKSQKERKIDWFIGGWDDKWPINLLWAKWLPLILKDVCFTNKWALSDLSSSQIQHQDEIIFWFDELF